MEETKTTHAEVRSLRTFQDATFSTAFHAGADAIERALQASFELGDATRRELIHAAFAAADLVETAQQSAAKVVRETLAKLDKVTEHAVGGAQTTALGLVSSLRGAGARTVDVVARATESVTEPPARSSAA